MAKLFIARLVINLNLGKNLIRERVMEKVIGIIDLKSFYASCECACRHLDPFKTPLVCCDPYRTDSSVVMSVTPYLKEKYGIPNVCRKKDLPKIDGMIFAEPRMSYYLRISAKVVSIFLDYVSYEDLHVYSIDESFLNLGPYMKMYGKKPEEIISDIQKRIKKELGLIATAGVGPNMFLAKAALDNEGKKKPPYISHWDYKDVKTKLWNIRPLTKIWGISNGISTHLSKIGIHTLKELALSPISLLEKEFGIMGHQLHDMANGLDGSDIEEKYVPLNESLTLGQTLKRDYRYEECHLLLKEMTDELCKRLRKNNKQTGRISLSLMGLDIGMFTKQRSLSITSDSPSYLFKEIDELFLEFPKSKRIRHISIAYSSLNEAEYDQISLFMDNPSEKDLYSTIDYINETYGENAVLRCSSLLSNSTIREKHMQIGGHKR